LKTNFLVVFLLLSTLVLYGNSGQNDKMPSMNRTEWMRKCVKEPYSFVGGSSKNTSEKEALDAAIKDALVRLIESFSVQVNSETVIKQVEITGKYSHQIMTNSRFLSKSIEVKNYRQRNFSVEQEGDEYNAWVCIEIPRSEYERIKIEVLGLTAWSLKSDFSECNYDRIRPLIPVFKKNGVEIGNDQKEDFDKSIREIAAKYPHNAYFLRIECTKGKESQNGREFYSRINFNVELLSLLSGKKVNFWKAREANTLKGANVKGFGYSREEARENGIEKAIEKIIEQINESSKDAESILKI
jgi:hypothetical protein